MLLNIHYFPVNVFVLSIWDMLAQNLGRFARTTLVQIANLIFFQSSLTGQLTPQKFIQEERLTYNYNCR